MYLGGRMGKPKILVIGDWFIDENWLMAKTNNYHSTDVGEAHYESLVEGPANFVLSVCGVASVLKILSGDGMGINPGILVKDSEDCDSKVKTNEINKSLISKYDIVGVGAWNPRDTQIIERILCGKNKQKNFMTPFTLDNDLKSSTEKCGGNPDGNCILCNEKKYQIINIVKSEGDSHKGISTNRIYRVYEGFGSQKPKLKYRFDWQIDLKKEFVDEQWYEEIKDLGSDDDVKAVIIVDHGKGVITPGLINLLLKKYKSAAWYARNKLKKPSWFECLNKKKKLKLLVVDQQLVNHTSGRRTWERNGNLCRASLELLGQNLGIETFEHGKSKESKLIKSENTAVLFEENWAIGASRKLESINKEFEEELHSSGLEKKIDTARAYYFPRLTERKRYIRVGRTSIFFNSLIYWDLMVRDISKPIEIIEKNIKKEIDDTELSLATLWALLNMEKWMDECTDAWIKEEDHALTGPFAEVLGWYKAETCRNDEVRKLKEKSIQGEEYHRGEDYHRSWKKWNDSSKNEGVIITSEGNQEFHLWRSYGTLDSYVCPGGTKRSSINELVQSLHAFRNNPKPPVPLNTLLVAEPGWGKSYLAECLSNHFDFYFLSYSIAQMSTTKELVDSFKEISSIQKQSEKPCLIFMDEIDAEISGYNVLGLLLSPMWDGKFKSDGYTNKIDPCAWIFAGTKSQKMMLNLPKGRDFISRINGPIIDIDFLNDKIRSEINPINPEKRDNLPEEERQEKLINAIRAVNIGVERMTEIVYQTVNLLNIEYGPITEIELIVLKLFSNILPLNGIRSLKIFVTKFRNIKKGIIRKENVPQLIKNSEMEKQIKLINQDVYMEKFLTCKEQETVKIRLFVTE